MDSTIHLLNNWGLVNKSPAAFIFIRKIDDLQRENRSTISNKKERVCEQATKVLAVILVNFTRGLR